MQRILGRTILALAISASPILWGCGDELPPAPGGSGDNLATKIVFSEILEQAPNWSERGLIKVMNPDGSDQAEIGRGRILGRTGINRIAFVRNDSIFVATLRNGAWEMKHIPTGENDTELNIASVSLSSDGRYVTFTTFRNGTGNAQYLSTYLALADGSGIGTPLPVAVAGGCTPVFSRDGRKLAFYGVPRDSNNSFVDPARIYVFDTGTNNYKVVGYVGEAAVDGAALLDLSPDGSRVVYADDSSGTLYTANTDGSGSPRKLTEFGMTPAWSPDGTRIVYVGATPGNTEVMIINADGSGTPLKLTNTIGQLEMFPQFSPDGRKIVYSVSSGDPEKFSASIKTLDLNNPAATVTLSTSGFKALWLRTDP